MSVFEDEFEDEIQEENNKEDKNTLFEVSKNKRGRPKKPAFKKKVKQLPISLNEDEYRKLEKISDIENISMAEFLRQCINNYKGI